MERGSRPSSGEALAKDLQPWPTRLALNIVAEADGTRSTGRMQDEIYKQLCLMATSVSVPVSQLDAVVRPGMWFAQYIWLQKVASCRQTRLSTSNSSQQPFSKREMLLGSMAVICHRRKTSSRTFARAALLLDW